MHTRTQSRTKAACLTALLSLATGCSTIESGEPIDLPDGPQPVDELATSRPAVAEQLRAAALDYLEKDSAPGLALAVIAGGEICHIAAYGWADVTSEAALRQDTPVLLSSVSKTFIGVAALQGLEAGRFELDAPVESLIDFELKNPHTKDKDITLRHLLEHSAGIVDGRQYDASYVEGDPSTELGDFLQDFLTRDSGRARARHFAARDSGEKFKYSNVGAALAAYAIAESAGLEFMDLAKRDIFDALGMADTAYLLSDLPRPAAVPYELVGGGQVAPYPQYGYPTYPDGMIRSSVRDMATYLVELTRSSLGRDNRLLQSLPLTVGLKVNEKIGTDEDGQAIAFARRDSGGVELFGHNGGDHGSFTDVWFDPSTGSGFVLLMNTSPNDGDAVGSLMGLMVRLSRGACLEPARDSG